MRAKNHQAMTMKDWVLKLNSFLQFNEKEILNDKGKVSVELAKRLAKRLAKGEFEKYQTIDNQNFESDFDRQIKNLKK
ncbi:MAG: hypothetical protein ACJAZX_001205 [Rickettsiales bacterium]